MRTLEGKVAFITGGARGQGRSHALTLARAGADIVVCDVVRQIESVPYPMASGGDLDETVALVEAEGRRCIGVVADVRDSAAVENAVRRAVAELGRLDIAVANAGIWTPSTVAEMSVDAWRDVIDVDLTGVFHTIRAAARPMRDAGRGRIVATASTAGRQGMHSMANYVAAKWGVIGLVKSAAMELGRYGITVNAVCPTTVKTPATDNEVAYRLFLPDKDNPNADDVDEMVRERLHALPVGWLASQDISDAILFLVSDQARFITGTALDISAGVGAQYAA
jgi:SDR family mycofactocin-dependent oxidoreductase